MSYENLNEALELAKSCEYYTVIGAKSDEVIERAEELFGRKFSRQNYEFFKTVGYLSFFGNEFYGICKDDFSGPYTGCAIEATLQDRISINLPNEWLTLYFFDDGCYGYLDYSQLNEDEEPPLIMATYNGSKFIEINKVAEDLGEFLLRRVKKQLAEQ